MEHLQYMIQKIFSIIEFDQFVDYKLLEMEIIRASKEPISMLIYMTNIQYTLFSIFCIIC